MAHYDFKRIEKKWQQYWKEHRSFVAEKKSDKPKYYVLDMFPYPSGSGLHVGHPLGYIATDIVTRYKRAKGFNVLHPMGFDAFGLPAEQYAIKTGIHPAETTQKNTDRYLEQMEMLGLYHDPDTVLRTSDPEYYKWTQWIFLKLFKHWYNQETQKAETIESLVVRFEKEGNGAIKAATDLEETFSAEEWKAMSAQDQAEVLMNYRLAYQGYATVNWCPDLGTVLADAEVKDGRSERGNFPVERKQMRQWILRISAYADRLLAGLNSIDWSESLLTIQRNWIGRSEGASITYALHGFDDKLKVFTTRPDTIFGNTFMVVAPEHPLVAKITSEEQKEAVAEYVNWASNRSEKERMADTQKTGVWTGAYALNPFTGRKLPIWISDYVVITYGTGAIMAVPAHDQRDYEFAHKFGIEIIQAISGGDLSKAAHETKEGVMIDSGFMTGMQVKDAITAIIDKLEEMGIGKRRVTYKQRDVVWSRQRYWGEPTPIYYKDGVAHAMDEADLPLELPPVESYLPSETGEPPLSRAESWKNLPDGITRDLNTMPGLAGSSWYFLRYPDAENNDRFVDPEVEKYWMPVDLYVGGTEHAVGHLMYSRFWTKFLYDIGEVSIEEPFSKLVNQGKIQGVSQLAFRNKETGTYVSADLVSKEQTDHYDQDIRVEINLVSEERSGNDASYTLDVEAYKKLTRQPELQFELNDKGEFHTTPAVEKMSKSYYNAVTPDSICEEYGADTMRLYEMFLGPLETDKPWDTEGITGVSNFLRKAFRMFVDEAGKVLVSEEKATAEELKALHETLKKVDEGIERLAFNTCIPAFMVFERSMRKLNCNKREVLEPFLISMAPFAPHFCEELWEMLGHKESILFAAFPQWEEKYLVEDTVQYPVQINGKVRFKLSVPADMPKDEVEKTVLADEKAAKWLADKTPRKIIVVPGRIINIVL